MDMKDPSFNYEEHGQEYSNYRKTDPRISKFVLEAVGPAKNVLNVGAGAGSYEPEDRYVVAIEPSSAMRSQRLKDGKFPAVIGTAGALPFDDNSFDASMAILTVHHWPNLEEGLKELRRVTRKQVIIMTYDPDALDLFWNVHYFQELVDVEKSRYPAINLIRETLGGSSEIKQIPIPFDCLDGFQEAFYGRPEAFLEKEVRQAQSAWGFLSEKVEERLVYQLEKDLKSGMWDKRFGKHRNMSSFNGALRLITSTSNE